MEAIPEYSFEDEMNESMDISQAQDTRNEASAPPSRPTRSHDVEHPADSNSDSDSENNNVSTLLPATAELKKRLPALQSRHPKRPLDPAPSAPKPKKPKKEIDVREAARQRRQEQDEAANKDLNNLLSVFEGEDIEAIRNLAVVEEMEITPRQRPSRTRGEDAVIGENDERWNPLWNGRKNFKKFVRNRERGANGAAAGPGGRRAIRVQAVIVPLEEVKKKGFGMGDEFWEGSASRAPDSRGTSVSRSQSQSQSQLQAVRKGKARRNEGIDEDTDMRVADDGAVLDIDPPSNGEDDNDDDGENYWAQRRAQKAKRSRDSTQNTSAPKDSSILVPSCVLELEDEAMQITGETIDVEQPRTTRHGHDSVEAKKKTATPTASASKTKPAAKSSLRQSRLGHKKERDDAGSDDDDDDGLKFRFRRKRN